MVPELMAVASDRGRGDAEAESSQTDLQDCGVAEGRRQGCNLPGERSVRVRGTGPRHRPQGPCRPGGTRRPQAWLRAGLSIEQRRREAASVIGRIGRCEDPISPVLPAPALSRGNEVVSNFVGGEVTEDAPDQGPRDFDGALDGFAFANPPLPPGGSVGTRSRFATRRTAGRHHGSPPRRFQPDAPHAPGPCRWARLRLGTDAALRPQRLTSVHSPRNCFGRSRCAAVR